MLAVVACKNAGYPRQCPWAFVSAWFDEAPTGKVFGVSSGCPWRTRRWRRCADVLRSRESLDDEHRSTTVSAHEGGPNGAGCSGPDNVAGHKLLGDLRDSDHACLLFGIE